MGIMRSRAAVAVVVALMLAGGALGDMYLQGCGLKGSNDRLNERSTNRNNAQRLFDSQNNAKGGYCVHPKMHFYVGSLMPIEWTNQHGCGGNPNVHCDIVLQYMCGDDPSQIRNGRTTQTIPNDATTYQTLEADNDPANDKIDPDELTDAGEAYRYGMHEPIEYYQACRERNRNRGLFIADRNVGSRATATRQNNGGTRHGFECAEERDYYPYWHPSPWKDIAVLTDHPSRCEHYQSESFNVKEKHYCTVQRQNNEQDCIDNLGSWEAADPHDIDEPECKEAPWSRDNHLGNSHGTQTTSQYNWTIPDDPHKFCVLRIRYNISSGDYDGWDTFSESNGAASPVKNDPYVMVESANLSLAINTAQFGRVFQDRSHVFEIRARPRHVPFVSRIYNLNVRGKRGNIVQTYPATEYDFCPAELEVRNGDYVHFQWSGCDHNPNGNDGEGTRGTDRSNLVQMDGRAPNHPRGADTEEFFDEDDRVLMAHLNQGPCSTLDELITRNGGQNDALDRDVQNCMKLNGGPRYFDGGLVRIHHTEGAYHFMSTRNNNFTNRSQKMSIIVLPFLAAWGIVLAVMGGALAVSGGAIAGVAVGAKVFPASPVGQCWYRLV